MHSHNEHTRHSISIDSSVVSDERIKSPAAGSYHGSYVSLWLATYRHFVDVANRTFRYFASSPPGGFAPLDVSIPAPPWTFRCRTTKKFLQYRKLQTSSETSMNPIA